MKRIKTLAIALFCAAAAIAGAQSGAEKQDIQKLITDVRVDSANSQVTSQEVKALETALLAAASTAHKPNPAYVTQLRTIVRTALQSGPITSAERTAIAKDLNIVLVSAGITEAEAVAVEDALLAIWNSTNFTKTELQELAADLRAIVSDLPNPPTRP